MEIADSEVDYEAGAVLLVDKPKGWSSFDAVKKVRFGLKVKKIGHAGTLDPLASGLLIMCTGKMTKQIERFQGMPKTYDCEMLIGKTTPSVDLETEFDSESDFSYVTEEMVIQAMEHFTGVLQQVPPVYSAVKVDGVRAYKKSRAGQEIALNAREVTVYQLYATEINLPLIKFTAVCSKGTYIRSLVKDIGAHLGPGAYMSELRRTKIGDFDVAHSLEPAQLLEKHRLHTGI